MCESFAFVAKNVVFRGSDCRSGESGEIRAQGRELRICRPIAVSEIATPEPEHHLARKNVPLGECAVRTALTRRIESGVDQAEMPQRRSIAARPERRCDRQVSARAVSADRKVCRIKVKRRRGYGDPLERLKGVLGWPRKGCFRRKPVIDRDHGASGAPGKLAADRVMCVDTAPDPPSSVEKQERRKVH